MNIFIFLHKNRVKLSNPDDASILKIFIFIYFRIRPDTDRFTFCNGVVWEKAQVLASFGNDWLNGILEFSKSLHALGLDLTSFVCLCGLTLVTGTFLFGIYT